MSHVLKKLWDIANNIRDKGCKHKEIDTKFWEQCSTEVPKQSVTFGKYICDKLCKNAALS